MVGSWRAGRLRMRSLILLGMVVPVVGVAGLAGGRVVERLDARETSVDLRTATEELRAAIGLRAAIAEEEIHSTVLGLAADFGVDAGDLEGLGDGKVLDHLDEARAAVDGLRGRRPGPALDRAFAALDGLRPRLDAGQLGQAGVVEAFASVNDVLRDAWAEQLGRIERTADARPLDGEIRRRLRTLRQSVYAFEQGGPQINAALQILLVEPTREALVRLLEAQARFEAAAEQADPIPGSRAEAAWEAYAVSPETTRTEALIDQATTVALAGTAPWADPDPQVLVAGIEDGEAWGSLLVAVPEAAAADLSASAGARSADAEAAVRTEVLRALALVLASVAVALWIARILARPSSDLEMAARRVERGDFRLPPVPARGPREVQATVMAFNDMAATLAAVEDHAVALAEDPSSPVLDDPLPGRTGHAMQAALDRLRRSLDEAEANRVELVELATQDGLTGLLNRAAAYAAVDRELARARRERVSLLAVYVDLDGLKELNDTYGHEAGDAAIAGTAAALRATTRRADVVARLGGDEFVVVGPVPAGGPDAVLAFAERIHASVNAQAVAVRGGRRELHCSIGVALSSPTGDTTEGLLRAADAAMYRAKAAGRDRVITTWHGPSDAPQLV